MSVSVKATAPVHRGEHGHAGVEVVVDLGDVLAGFIAQDLTDLLGDALPGRDGEGEEQRVEPAALEALTDVWRPR